MTGRFTRIELTNWRNFRSVDVPLSRRVFIYGPNASGKSNFLDSFRFLRDIAEPEGSLRRAVEGKRKGLKLLRSLHARDRNDVRVRVEVEIDATLWSYELAITADNKGKPIVKKERVLRGDQVVLLRPKPSEAGDPLLLTQTHLEQVSLNKEFRPLASFLAQVEYTHVVPQIVKQPLRQDHGQTGGDPFGTDFLDAIAGTKTQARDRRLKKISKALEAIVPQFRELEFHHDSLGLPHLRAKYKHWRASESWQQEDQFSDGTLRLLGLLWTLSAGAAPLLLEEPEISLHEEAIRQIPGLLARVQAMTNRQVIISTHSGAMLADPGVAPEEVLYLEPTKEDTKIRLASDDPQMSLLAREGQGFGDLVIAATAPRRAEQLALAFDK